MASTTRFSLLDSWAANLDILEPHDIHTTIHIEQDKDSKVSFKETRITSGAIPNMCEMARTDKDATWLLRLVVTPQKYERVQTRRIPYSEATIEAFKQHWNIPDICFQAPLQTETCCFQFSPIACDPAWSGFFLHLTYGLSFTSTVIITHNSDTRSTFGVYSGVDPSQVSHVVEKLCRTQSHAFQPELVPLCIMDLAVTQLRTFCYKTYSDFLPIREAMGINLYYFPAQNFQSPELTHMPQKLTALINVAAGNAAALQSTSDIIHYLGRILQAVQPPTQLVVDMRDHLAFLQQILDGTRRKNEYMRESVQGIVQMVYAVLQQKDNELNHRYGADMRMVAIVTLLFLPGTFVATLFSASCE
ncbi:uncharacterized protein K460DRAFT_390765 [Cucurbitaria berberidis CBS 394.84]|uniref:Uncharacterized protein n=1 Tax=Cucurbitaria berberidis CBS 394.84 TaxID=1168544 RepID=A0A9P4LDL4_9PLEO|nr:uncharacterized protein K460DRAFT_390765 [Cucurbitaria berberidis CBS 394.84]KAF1850219.1 hypothetical protein K460DRAFT_390765 [Cucurbitaria berberidis CBS 394.84]